MENEWEAAPTEVFALLMQLTVGVRQFTITVKDVKHVATEQISTILNQHWTVCPLICAVFVY